MPTISTNCLRHHPPQQSMSFRIGRTYRSGDRVTRRTEFVATSGAGRQGARPWRLRPATPAPIVTPAAEAGDAIDSTLAVATAAGERQHRAKVAGHRRSLPVRVRNADYGTICINPQQCGNRQKPTPMIAWALPPPPPPPLTMLGRATACWRARGGSGAGRARRGSSRSGWRLVCLRRGRASSSSSFLREAVAGAFGFSSATQVSPFSVSPLLHSIGQTRVVCLASSATSFVVTLILSDG